jgi:hypothetical protein
MTLNIKLQMKKKNAVHRPAYVLIYNNRKSLLLRIDEQKKKKMSLLRSVFESKKSFSCGTS